MRRQDRKLESEEILEVLKNGEYGILATITNDGKPYSVPLSYALDEGSHVLYMHCSAEGGQKIDNLRLHPEACFTVVSQTELMPEKFATKYWSANVFGSVTIIEEGQEKQKGDEVIERWGSPYTEMNNGQVIFLDGDQGLAIHFRDDGKADIIDIFYDHEMASMY